MLLRSVHTRRWLAAVAVPLLALGGTAAAQSLNDGMEGLQKKYRANRDLIGSLLRAKTVLDPNNAVQVEAVDVMAKLATYPLVLEVDDKKPGEIDKHFRGYLESDLSHILTYKDKNPEMPKVYADKVRVHALEVFAHPSAKPIIRVNAARMLARLGELGQPELADDLVELLHTPPPRGNDGVRYWALKGLRDLLAVNNDIGEPALDKARREKVTVALLDFLQHPPAFASNAAPDEVEGYKLLRREGVRALAEVRRPYFNPKVRPAVVLARFAADDARLRPRPTRADAGPSMDDGGIDAPDPGADAPADDGSRGGGRGGRGAGRGRRAEASLGARLDEQLEAVIGLARLRPDKKEWPGYQPDYAAEQIAHFVAAFGKMASEDEDRQAKDHLRPWKVDAVRMLGPVGAMGSEIRDPFIEKVAGATVRVLNQIIQGGQASAADMSFLADAKAANQTLFRGDRETSVRPSPPSGAMPGGMPGGGGRRGRGARGGIGG
jgi:hypothetical protein